MDEHMTMLGGAIIAGLIIGALLAWLIARARYRAERDVAIAMVRAEHQAAFATQTARAEEAERLSQSRHDDMRHAQGELERLNADLDRAREELSRLSERASRIPVLDAQLNETRLQSSAEIERLAGLLSTKESEVSALRVDVERLTQQLKAEQASAADKLKVLTDAQDNLKDQFKSLASEILDTNSKRLQEQNQTNLSTLLDPLKQKLTDFQKKVEEVYVDESKERSALKQQVESLVSLNKLLSEDAKNLTAALRGSAKSQGNWGELILERVLEASGLRKGEEYVVQDSQTNEHGQRFQPDVVINLPEGRRLVVDSKVSLIAYERYASAETDAERDVALREHLTSVRNHMRALSDKRYQILYGPTLDFVLMFVPVEPAFMTSVTNDSQLFMDAWERNVLLVSPSTLLFVVRTVAHLWRQEAQNRNAQEIAKRGAELFDRLTAFVEDLDALGKRLEMAQQSFLEAKRKLSTNRGNVIRQAEMLKDLGVRPTKQLPASWLESTGDSLEALPLDVEPDARTLDQT